MIEWKGFTVDIPVEKLPTEGKGMESLVLGYCA